MTFKSTWDNAVSGWTVEPPCPKCGGAAFYNGNYFCGEWDCKWALASENRTAKENTWFEKAYTSTETR